MEWSGVERDREERYESQAQHAVSLLDPHLAPGQVNAELLQSFVCVVKVAVHEGEAVQPRQRQQLRHRQHASQVHVILNIYVCIVIMESYEYLYIQIYECMYECIYATCVCKFMYALCDMHYTFMLRQSRFSSLPMVRGTVPLSMLRCRSSCRSSTQILVCYVYSVIRNDTYIHIIHTYHTYTYIHANLFPYLSM